MRPPIVGRFPRLALSTILPLCLLTASTGLGLPSNAADSRSPLIRDSGIRGRVLLGSLKPSSRIGETNLDKPFQTTLDIVRAEDESLVKQIRTRHNGTFIVALAPGDYIVRSASSDEIRRPSIDPVPVTVPPHTYVDVTINADTGIR